MKNFFTLIFLSSILSTFAQVAIINDPDGFTNVRLEPNSNSEIIHVLKENEMFLYDYNFTLEDEWINVYIPKNKFIDNLNFSNNSDYLFGFIHISRLKDISELPKYNGNKFSFSYDLIPFTKENKIIDYIKATNNKYISKINGLNVYGTDGEIPTIEIKNINVFLNKKQIFIPQILFQNLFEVDGEINIKKFQDHYFVSQINSDGASGYEVIWLFNETGLIQRLIFIP